MYQSRKNTNINKHKFYHPGTARNQQKLENAEHDQLEKLRHDAERQNHIEKERAEIQLLAIVDPEAAKKKELQWMYEDWSFSKSADNSLVSNSSLQKNTTSNTSNTSRSTTSSLSMHSNRRDLKHSEGGAQRDIDRKSKLMEDPMALIYAMRDRQTYGSF